MSAAHAGGAPVLEVLTPTYRPDLGLCRDLNASVLRFGGATTRHRLVVPARDRSLAASLAGPRTTVETASRHLPRGFVPVPGNLHVNLSHPFPPVRGWVSQQLVKLAATASSDADLVVVADSDLVFVRPFGPDTFRRDGVALLYRLDGGVHAGLPRHVEWHRTARRVLGLPAAVDAPLPDYICWPCAWEPSVVRRMLAHIEAVHRRSWQTTLAGCLHLSEMIVYGVYVDEVLGGAAATTSRMHCLRHTHETPFDEAGLDDFLSGLRADHLSVMISAKSGTDEDTRRAALAPVLGAAAQPSPQVLPPSMRKSRTGVVAAKLTSKAPRRIG